MHPPTLFSYLIIATFAIGYLCIIFEHIIGINKATSAIIMAVVCWTLQFMDPYAVDYAHLNVYIANVSQIILFLLGALAIVETMHAHGGLNLVSNLLTTQSKVYALWIIGAIAFFLSSILDNLTTTIVMVTIMRKLVRETEERWIFGSAIVIAANAGGAWTPIGDVTTTMLWVGGQISSWATMKSLFLPSLINCATSLLFFSYALKGGRFTGVGLTKEEQLELQPYGKLVFILGMSALVFVPIFKMLTGLPPFLGMLLGLGVLWVCTDLLHKNLATRQHLKMTEVFTRIDMSSILFFLGILLSVSALEAEGILEDLALIFDTYIPSKEVITMLIGLVSAVIDNVPLVAACMGMYDLAIHPMDSNFWQLVAYAAGTGGSILIIGSAAGIAFMGLEKVTFFWYLRRASIPAALGYFAGFLVYHLLFNIS